MQPAVTPAWDAVVIGGGPAGSGVATYLAQEGRRVLVLERAHFPREHIGESLLPGVLPYLERLGVRREIEEAGFERKEGQTFYWGKEQPWEIDFRELDVHPYSYFVDRARFDDMLLRHAARSGATVLEGQAVTRVLFERGRAVGVEVTGPGGAGRVEKGAFVIDASGQAALVARGAGLRRHVRGLKNVAVWAYWRGAARMDGHRHAHILAASIPGGWIWVIPLAEGRTSVGVVTSKATRAERDRMGTCDWYEAELRACAPVGALLARATRETPVRAARDWSYRSRRMSGPGILLAGDAACFIDPILSTGVHLAMTSAYWAASVVHSSLAQPKLEPIFRSFYDQTYGAMYRELLTQVKAFYKAEGRRDSVFWTSKELLRVGGAVAPDRAFLFITAGLLRNAAVDEPPHDVLAQTRRALGRESGPAAVPTALGAGPRARVVSPPLVFRIGAQGGCRLCTVRADGLSLSLTEHEPRGLLDRPRETYFVLDLVDADRLPFALALVEGRRPGMPKGMGRFAVRVLPYPVRPIPPGVVHDLTGALHRLIAALDDPARPLALARVRSRLRAALRETKALPHGITAAGSREHRGGGVAEPAMTAIFDAPSSALPRVYLQIEARLPPELTELPVLRTRFLDGWVRPERGPDGRPLTDWPEVAAFLAAACERLWAALASAGTTAAAFAAAERVLCAQGGWPHAYRLVASGRLGDPR